MRLWTLRPDIKAIFSPYFRAALQSKNLPSKSRARSLRGNTRGKTGNNKQCSAPCCTRCHEHIALTESVLCVWRNMCINSLLICVLGGQGAFLHVWRDFSEEIILPISHPSGNDSPACIYTWTRPLSITVDQNNLSESVAGPHLLQGEMLYRHIAFRDGLVTAASLQDRCYFPCLLSRSRPLKVLLQLHSFPWLALATFLPSSLCTQSVTEHISSTHCTAANPSNLIVMYKFLLAGQ